MGQRHNRKRTRSRPRYRNQDRHCSRDGSFVSSPDIATPIGRSPTLNPYSNRSATYWDGKYAAWQARSVRQQEQEAMEAYRLRVYGGVVGEDISLCAPMLKVVLDLFDDIDYVDP